MSTNYQRGKYGKLLKRFSGFFVGFTATISCFIGILVDNKTMAPIIPSAEVISTLSTIVKTIYQEGASALDEENEFFYYENLEYDEETYPESNELGIKNTEESANVNNNSIAKKIEYNIVVISPQKYEIHYSSLNRPSIYFHYSHNKFLTEVEPFGMVFARVLAFGGIIGFIIGLSCSLAILFVAYKIADFSDLMSLILYKRNKEKEETSKPPVVTQTATNSNINNSGKDIPIVKTITVSTKTIHPDK